MSWQAISGNPFFTVAFPIILTFVFSTWFSNRSQNKRIDDLNKRIDDMVVSLRSEMRSGFDAVNRRFDDVDRRFDAVDRRLEKIEAKLDNHAERISKLEGPALVRA